jgi:hypothetical protein
MPPFRERLTEKAAESRFLSILMERERTKRLNLPLFARKGILVPLLAISREIIILIDTNTAKTIRGQLVSIA